MLVAGCNTGDVANEPTPSPTASAEGVRAAVEAANADINTLIKAGRFEDAGRHFAPDVVQLISGMPPIYGRQAWIDAQRQASQIGTWDLQLEVLDLEIRDDLAVERGRGVQTFTANESSPMPSFTTVGDYIVLWKRVDGRWQIQWDYVVLEPPTE
jgi:ketosteroid isomerase-like protein